MPGTALSLSAAIFGALQGQLGSLASKWLDYKYKLKHLKTSAYLKDLANARSVKSREFLITRRILALITALYIFVGPIFAAWWGIPVFSAYSESNGWISNIELAHQIHKPISKVDKILEDLKEEGFVDVRPAK